MSGFDDTAEDETTSLMGILTTDVVDIPIPPGPEPIQFCFLMYTYFHGVDSDRGGSVRHHLHVTHLTHVLA